MLVTVAWLVGTAWITFGCSHAPMNQACAADVDCPSAQPMCGCAGVCTTTTLLDGGAVPTTRAYVIASLRAFVANDPTLTHAYGLDLDDDAARSGCAMGEDWISPITFDPHVDNQLQNGLGPAGSQLDRDGWDAAIADAIEFGDYLVVLEVTDPGTRSCARSVRVWTAHTMGGGPPAASSECSTRTTQTDCERMIVDPCFWRPSELRCSGIAANQVFTAVSDLGVVDAELAAMLRTTTALQRMPLIPHAMGLSASSPAGPAPIDMHGVFLRASVSDQGLVAGELGATLAMTDIVTWLHAHVGTSFDLPSVESILMPDQSPDATGTHCAAISAGFGFAAIPATLVH